MSDVVPPVAAAAAVSEPPACEPPVCEPTESRPQTYHVPRGRRAPEWYGQAMLLCVSLGFLGLAWGLEIRNQQRVAVKGIPFVLPESCGFKVMSGLPCPGCGLTRCTIACAHGDWMAAWSYNPAGILIFLAAAVQVPYRSLQLVRLARGQPLLELPGLVPFICFVGAVLVLQWLGKVLFL